MGPEANQEANQETNRTAERKNAVPMSGGGLVIQKYGGSSVATPEKIRNVALRVKARADAGSRLIVVVSAMGKTTDGLIALAKEVSASPPPREMDMLLATGEQVSAALLAMALNGLGVPAVSRNAFQLGIVTSENYSNARIRDIGLSLLREDFEKYKAVVVTGFQGITPEGDLTTLGRGGSDTSAVAMAAKALAMGETDVVCEIYSDVPGIFACDPNKVKGARKLDCITYEEMLELAALGAKVLHMRSVALARKYGVVLYCASTFSEERGTYVVKELPEWLENPVVTGVTVARNQMKFVVRRIPGSGDALSGIFRVLALAGANIDMISAASDNGLTFLAFTLQDGDAASAVEAVAGYMKEKGLEGWEIEPGVPVAKVSAVGDGMNAATGVAERVFSALQSRGIEILGISTSEINISILVEGSRADDAVNALAQEFGLIE
ncbi:MAG: aspartate kinase [Synergistaceae bacterium]|jgi:aspartate kinase|nr:aspartate kinase [Synergistaceae bacterium]